jgi:alginate O-acetyltransferase complex protein AlgI
VVLPFSLDIPSVPADEIRGVSLHSILGVREGQKRQAAMLFCTNKFLFFFTAVFAVYWLLPWRRGRVYWLLAASFYFYACWNKHLAGLICVSTLFDFLAARGMEASTSPRLRKGLLGLSLTMNLGMLAYFKYANFFLRSVEDALRAAGQTASLPVLSILLPIGISFYTFEAVSYTVDVYRRRIPAERDLAHFMLFILFFPHLVAGPVVRARDFLPQANRLKRWDWARLCLGAQYVLIGCFKKLAIGDRMALFADPIFANPAVHGCAALWLATFAYALQVFCDFSGYSDIAIGCAHLLGYKLAQNFDMPYLSRNLSEFWRRWHISLSSWLRDYVFIPLGGSRDGRWQTYRNLLVTMTLAGLWHGANWTYMLFGLVQGGLLCLHRHFAEFSASRPSLGRVLQSAGGTALRVACTFLCFCTTLVIFRSASLGAAWTMLGRMLSSADGLPSPLHPRGFWITAAVVALGHLLGYLLGKRGLWRRLAEGVPVPIRGMGFAALLTLALVLGPDASKAFVYFQF